jgi:hypothetical protein
MFQSGGDPQSIEEDGAAVRTDAVSVSQEPGASRRPFVQSSIHQLDCGNVSVEVSVAHVIPSFQGSPREVVRMKGHD